MCTSCLGQNKKALSKCAIIILMFSHLSWVCSIFATLDSRRPPLHGEIEWTLSNTVFFSCSVRNWSQRSVRWRRPSVTWWRSKTPQRPSVRSCRQSWGDGKLAPISWLNSAARQTLRSSRGQCEWRGGGDVWGGGGDIWGWRMKGGVTWGGRWHMEGWHEGGGDIWGLGEVWRVRGRVKCEGRVTYEEEGWHVRGGWHMRGRGWCMRGGVTMVIPCVTELMF